MKLEWIVRRFDGHLLLSPSDLVAFLGCEHASALDFQALQGRTVPPPASDPFATFLQQKGFELEHDLVEILLEHGEDVVRIPDHVGLTERLARTAEAMKAGAGFIYQGALLHGHWHGITDFLMRTDDTPSAFGSWAYEVADAKLASHVAPRHVVQTTLYSGLLANIQGVRPTKMALALGNGATELLRPDEFSHYVRLAAQRLQRFLTSDAVSRTAPEPCAHCKLCRWRPRCEAEWQATDHLSLVAFMRRSQRDKLRIAGIGTTAALAAMPNSSLVHGMAPESLARLRSQARLQVSVRGTSEHHFELLPRSPGRGFARLPQPNPADLFLDLEGDPLFPGGLDYLFGLQVGAGDAGRYRAWWGHDPEGERHAAENILDFIAEHLAQHPRAFIYHYGNYEVAALRRLVMRHGTREDIVDDLLRDQKFVDLYGIVREGVQISEPHYSLKDLEKLYQGGREGDVATAMESVLAYETWRSLGDNHLLRNIETYNAADCRSASAARDWLLAIRPADVNWFNPPPVSSGNDARQSDDDELALIERALVEEGPEADQPVRRLVADLLRFHKREQKPEWWALFDRRGRPQTDHIDDPECLGGLRLLEEPKLDILSLVHRYSFPEQDTKLKVGDRPIEVDTWEPVGSIQSLEMAERVVVLRRSADKGPLPSELAIGPGKPVGDRVLRDALKRFAIHFLEGDKRFIALERLLRREPPRLAPRKPGLPVILPSRDLMPGVLWAARELDNSTLYVQGPPGSGKTYTAAQVIVELLRSGKRIGVSSHSHNAINHLCRAIEEAAGHCGLEFHGYKKSTDEDSRLGGQIIQDRTSIDRIPGNAQLVAGTAWLFANPRFEQMFDYLVVDEAGQVSLANLVAMGTAARNLILVGDQMQLSQPIQGCHPGESGCSALEYLLQGQATVPPDLGILLDTTWRMHPSLCGWVSEAIYDGRLKAHPSLAQQSLLLSPGAHPALAASGLSFVPVEHAGRTQRSPEEAEVARAIWHSLMQQRWRDRHGRESFLDPEDVLVVAAYNMQANAIRDLLPAGARVGTVDRFQGLEAPVVILSMATSSGEDLPRDVGFLFSRQRLNVAISRARCLAVVLASPRLLEVPCRTVEDLRLVNTLCHASEWARKFGEL